MHTPRFIAYSVAAAILRSLAKYEGQQIKNVSLSKWLMSFNIFIEWHV